MVPDCLKRKLLTATVIGIEMPLQKSVSTYRHAHIFLISHDLDTSLSVLAHNNHPKNQLTIILTFEHGDKNRNIMKLTLTYYSSNKE